MESKIIELWEKGLLHNSNGPAVKTQRLGRLYEEHWNNGKLHRGNGPAVIHDGINQEFYKKNRKKSTKKLGEAIKLPYLDNKDFNKVKYLNTKQRKWQKFPGYKGQNIPIYLNNILGGLNPFSRFGDFGATAKFFVDRFKTQNSNTLLGELLKSLDEVKYSISYEDKVSAEGPTLVDTLGSYNLKNKLITLHIKKIFFCAQDIDTKFSNFSGSTAMTLTYMIFLHELGHAIHHAVRGGSREDADMLKDKEKCEIIAQYFMMTCINLFGVRAVCIENELDQPAIYSKWRPYVTLNKPTTFKNFKELLESDTKYLEYIIGVKSLKKQKKVKGVISKNDRSGWDL